MIEKENVVEKTLKQIEFPGEDADKIETFLRDANISKTVIRQILAAENRRQRIKVWGIIALCAFALLLILGANRYVTEFIFFFQSAILLFISVALMAVCLTSIIGVIMNIDKHKVELGFRHSGERIEEFFEKLFHIR